MALPRKSLISLGDTPFYHCVSRCVRRAFLCGIDHYSGKCYEHRRDWLEALLLKNADIFAIKLYADERALLSCMAYVDLNPIRAKMAKAPEASDFTSIKKRIDALTKGHQPSNSLEAFDGIQERQIGIPFTEPDYLDLVDWSGRILRDDKRGKISSHLPPILERLGLNEDHWKILTTEFETQFNHWVGSEHIVRQVCEDKSYQRIPKIQTHRRLLS